MVKDSPGVVPITRVKPKPNAVKLQSARGRQTCRGGCHDRSDDRGRKGRSNAQDPQGAASEPMRERGQGGGTGARQKRVARASSAAAMVGSGVVTDTGKGGGASGRRKPTTGRIVLRNRGARFLSSMKMVGVSLSSLPFLVCWGGWGFVCCLQSPIRSRGRLQVGLGSSNTIPVPDSMPELSLSLSLSRELRCRRAWEPRLVCCLFLPLGAIRLGGLKVEDKPCWLTHAPAPQDLLLPVSARHVKRAGGHTQLCIVTSRRPHHPAADHVCPNAPADILLMWVFESTPTHDHVLQACAGRVAQRHGERVWRQVHLAADTRQDVSLVVSSGLVAAAIHT